MFALWTTGLPTDVVGAVLLERLGMVDSQQLTRALMDAACQRARVSSMAAQPESRGLATARSA